MCRLSDGRRLFTLEKQSWVNIDIIFSLPAVSLTGVRQVGHRKDSFRKNFVDRQILSILGAAILVPVGGKVIHVHLLN